MWCPCVLGASTIDAQQQMRTKEPNIFAKEPHISTSAFGKVARIHCPHTNVIHFPQMSKLRLICLSHKRMSDSYLKYRSHARMSRVPRMIESRTSHVSYTNDSCYACHTPLISDSYVIHIHRPDTKNESFPTLGASYVCLIVFTKTWVISHVRARMNHLPH